MKGFVKKMSLNDMVYDHNMNPAWCNTPESCRKWLRFRIKQNPEILGRYKVRIWRDGSYVHISVAEYLKGGDE